MYLKLYNTCICISNTMLKFVFVFEGIKSINLYYFAFEIHFFVFVIKNTEEILTI